jgi:hypothetical protein
MRALEDLGHIVVGLDTDPPEVRKAQRGLFRRIQGKLYRLGWECDSPGKDLAGINVYILDHFRKSTWDILWIEKGLTILRETLRAVKELQPGCAIVGYSPDDMAARHNQSPQFLKGVNLYDVYITTKSYGVVELKALGCRHVLFCENAYDPRCHRPVQLSEGERKLLGGPVGFIGAFESQRAESIYRIAHAGFQVRIWGPWWERCRLKHPNFIVEHKPLWGEDYAKAVSAFDINLCFLRKINRDLQTTRSVEIPACGAFMLAERTEEHLGLFEEGKETEYFSSDEELISKVGFYLENPKMRKEIAEAGLERCIRSGYSNQNRLSIILIAIDKIKEGVTKEWAQS